MGKQLESLLVQKDQKLQQQDQIIQALSKKLAITESELAQKTELTSDYEQKFVQVREAVESEKMRYANQVQDLSETIETREKDLAKLDEKCKSMSEERATLLSK